MHFFSFIEFEPIVLGFVGASVIFVLFIIGTFFLIQRKPRSEKLENELRKLKSDLLRVESKIGRIKNGIDIADSRELTNLEQKRAQLTADIAVVKGSIDKLQPSAKPAVS